MEVINITHSRLAIITFEENFILGDTLHTEFANAINYEVENLRITLGWHFAFFCLSVESPIIHYEGKTYFTVKSVLNYDEDLPVIKLLVLESYEAFVRELKNNNIIPPMLDLKIEEISLALQEKLTLAGWY